LNTKNKPEGRGGVLISTPSPGDHGDPFFYLQTNAPLFITRESNFT